LYHSGNSGGLFFKQLSQNDAMGIGGTLYKKWMLAILKTMEN